MDGEAADIGEDPFAQLNDVFAGRAALLLEDDPALSEHVAERLLQAGFERVDRHDAGEGALEAAGARPYDVLILDRHTKGLDGLETLKVCVGYRLHGQEIDYLPAGLRDQAAVEPIYEELPGWSESTAGARSFKDLPANAVKYVGRIQELIGAPVALLSTSPERDDTILLRDPFQD